MLLGTGAKMFVNPEGRLLVQFLGVHGTMESPNPNERLVI